MNTPRPRQPLSPGLISAACRRLAFISAPLAMATAASLQAGPVDKNPAALSATDTHPMYLGTVTAGAKTSDVYTEGNFSIVAPVFSTLSADATLSGDVVYLEPYTSWGEGGEVAASLGLGWRHLFGSQPVSALTRRDSRQAGFLEEGFFIGGNVFLDMLDTEAGNQFWQLGMGLEAGTRYLEVRGNYYIPLSSKQLAEQTRTREVLRSSTSRDATSVTGVSDPYATGNLVAQDISYQTLRTTSTTITTIERLFRRYEEGMEGWDAGLALLVPGLDNYFDLRLTGGYYSFDNQPFGPQTGGTGNVEGWKAGVEIRPVPAVILTGTWYEDQRLTGSDWTAGLQLQLPFEAGDLGDGKGFWGRIGEAFKPRRRHLAERMAEPVHRQNAAIKVANTVDAETKATTSVKTVTKIVSQRPGQVVLADDIIFVNNGEAVGNGIQAGNNSKNGADGTAEKPFDSMSEAALVAASNSFTGSRLWTVYTQGGTTAPYTGTVITGAMTRFTSSYLPIAGLDGRNFGGDTARPVLEGGIASIYLSQTLIVEGYDIRGGIESGVAIGGINTLNALIQHNVFSDIADNNEQDDYDYSSVHFFIGDNQAHEIVIQDNLFDNVSDAVRLTLEPESKSDDLVVNLTASNNTLRNGENRTGFIIEAYGEVPSGTVNAWFTGNLFEGYVDTAFGAYASGDAMINASYSGNTFAGESGSSYGFDFTASGNATLMAAVEDNLWSGSFWNAGINASSDDESDIILTVQNNTFGGYFNNEVLFLQSAGQSSLTATVRDNHFSGDAYELVDGEQYQNSTLDLTFEENTVDGLVESDGFELGAFGSNTLGGMLKAVVQNNTFSGEFGGNVIFAEVEDEDIYTNGLLDLTVTGNQFTGSVSSDAIEVDADDESTVKATVSNNTVAATATLGEAFFDVASTGDAVVTITGLDNNLILGGVDYGFDFFYNSTGAFTVNGTIDNIVTNAFSSDLSLSPGITGSFLVNGMEFPF